MDRRLFELLGFWMVNGTDDGHFAGALGADNRFVGYEAYSLDLDIFAYIKVTDYGEYLVEVAEDLNLRIMDIVTKVERGKLHLLIVMGMPTPLTSVTVVWYIIVMRIKASRSHSVSPTE